MKNFGFKSGFTLAEVLISLAIISIVAALTIPALTIHFKKQTTSARLKKFYSVMTQAIRLSEIENGSYTTWEFSKAERAQNGDYLWAENFVSTAKFVNKYFIPYLNYSSIDEGHYIPATETEDSDYKRYTVYLSDGSLIAFHLGDCLDVAFDANGEKGPNITGRDQTVFAMCFPISGDWIYRMNPGFQPYFRFTMSTREQALQQCKSTGAYCSTLLFYDNWEFKDDYPYKL